MKKLTEKTVEGYYVISIASGALLTALLQLVYELICVEIVFQWRPASLLDELVDLNLPFYYMANLQVISSEAEWWQHYRTYRILAILMAMVLLGGLLLVFQGKKWRTKALQMIGYTMLTSLIASTLILAKDGTCGITVLLFLVTLMALPATILHKTRMPRPQNLVATNDVVATVNDEGNTASRKIQAATADVIYTLKRVWPVMLILIPVGIAAVYIIVSAVLGFLGTLLS